MCSVVWCGVGGGQRMRQASGEGGSCGHRRSVYLVPTGIGGDQRPETLQTPVIPCHSSYSQWFAVLR